MVSTKWIFFSVAFTVGRSKPVVHVLSTACRALYCSVQRLFCDLSSFMY